MHTARHRRPTPPTARPRAALVVAGSTLTAGALMLLAATGASADNDKTGTGGHKVVICHATSSESNPYTSNDVDVAGGWDGHDKHTGPAFSVNLPKHASWGDIIPQTTYGDVTFSLNWDATGQAIWNNNCNLPGTATQTSSAPASDTTSAPASETEGSTSAPASETDTTTAPASDTETTTAPASETEGSTSAPASGSEPASSSAPASSSGADGTSAAASSSAGVAGLSSSRAASSSDDAGVDGAEAGPIPAGANAGLHGPTRRTSLALWGAILMLIGGTSGLMLGLRPRRSRVH